MRCVNVLFASTIAVLIMFISGCAAAPQARPADLILADIEAVEMPRFDWEREDDEEYVKSFEAERELAHDRMSEYVWELYETHPDHEQVSELMRRRWWLPMDDPERLSRVRAELEYLAEKHPGDTTLGRYARQSLVWIPMRDAIYRDGDVNMAFDAFEWYLNEVGRGEHDEETADLLAQMQWAFEAGSPPQIVLYERLRDEFAGTGPAQMAEGRLRQFEAIGKPFDIEFTCAVTGKQVDMNMLKGKVVVVDFWATWCPPCVAKMPELKQLYQRHHKEGLEIVGVSLDMPEHGGIDKLRTFANEQGVNWPQWYLGKGWESEFSKKWGINSIPTLFLVDSNGILRSTTVAPDELTGEVFELLEERTARAAAGAEH